MEYLEKQSLCSKRRNKLLVKQTPSENMFASILDSFGLKYIKQKGFISGKNFCIVDFYLPKYKTCIEIDGGYHYEENQIKRDLNRDYYLNKTRGFGVLHIDNETLLNFENTPLLEMLEKLKNQRCIIKI